VGLRHADGLRLIPLGGTQPRSNHFKSSATAENIIASPRQELMPMAPLKDVRCMRVILNPNGNDCTASAAVTIIRQWQR